MNYRWDMVVLTDHFFLSESVEADKYSTSDAAVPEIDEDDGRIMETNS